MKSLRYFACEDPQENRRKLDANNKAGPIFDSSTASLTPGGRSSVASSVFKKARAPKHCSLGWCCTRFWANSRDSITLDVEWYSAFFPNQQGPVASIGRAIKAGKLKPVTGIGAADHLQLHCIVSGLEYRAFLSI